MRGGGGDGGGCPVSLKVNAHCQIASTVFKC